VLLLVLLVVLLLVLLVVVLQLTRSPQPFTDDFPPRFPLVAPRFHICHSCRAENDPCSSFYFKGWYHYFYQSHDKGGITGGHVVSKGTCTRCHVHCRCSDASLLQPLQPLN